MYQNICVIGLGTLGGFVSKYISELEEINEICIIDYDKVEDKNLTNSIYNKDHVGKYKIDSLEQIIKRDGLCITKVNERYLEGITILPKKYDLIIDCRDFTYDRHGEISFRLYISSRYLVVDCRKKVTYNSHSEGKYTSHINKIDLRYSGSMVANLVHNKYIDDLLNNESIESFELDDLQRKIQTSLNRGKEIDFIYEPDKIENKIINLKEKFNEIIEYNKNKEITFCLGSVNDFTIDKKIPMSSLKTYQDILAVLLPIVSLPYTHESYLIQPNTTINNKIYIQILPETGAA